MEFHIFPYQGLQQILTFIFGNTLSLVEQHLDRLVVLGRLELVGINGSKDLPATPRLLLQSRLVLNADDYPMPS